jgi:hypothetical protein
MESSVALKCKPRLLHDGGDPGRSHFFTSRGMLGVRSDARIGRMHAPADPNSDGWISFQQSPDGRYELIEADRFVIPRDMKSGDRAIDPCAIAYFPPHVKSALGGLVPFHTNVRKQKVHSTRLLPCTKTRFIRTSPSKC